MSFKINMNNMSFKSTIRPIGTKEFNTYTTRFGKKNFIAFPWTIKESVIANKVYTKSIEDCTFFGISDGIKVLGIHICPTMKENFDFSKIKNFIESKINFKDPNLQGFILGGRRHSQNNCSFNLFENLENIFKNNKIPYSKFKGGSHVNDVAYDSSKDEWLISTPFAKNKNLEAESIFNNIFDEVLISKDDEVCW